MTPIAIKSILQQHKVPERAVVIGAGFIGLEMAENLHEPGAEVAVVEMANQVMAPIDFSMAALVHEHLLQKGVHLYLEKAVASFEQARSTGWRLFLNRAKGCLPILCSSPSGYVRKLHWRRGRAGDSGRCAALR